MRHSQSKIKSAMFMAAGLGTRARPFSDRMPKPLFPVMGIPTAQFAVDHLLGVGVQNLVVNVHHLPEIARAGFQGLDLPSVQLQFSDESDQLLASGGGLRKALPLLGDAPFFMINPDVIFDFDLGALATCHHNLRQQHGVRLTLTVVQKSPGNEVYREIRVDPTSGLIVGLGHRGAGVPVFASAAVIESEAVQALPAGRPLEFVSEILEPAIRDGKAGAYVTQGLWLDIGSPESWLAAHFKLMRLLEMGRLIPLLRTRIESFNRRIADGIWVSKDSPHLGMNTADWSGPAYWSPHRQKQVLPPHRNFGPGAVVYGSAPSNFSNGISFEGIVYQTRD
jgi:MurNAc alpha-1-phosphate uridylyltransferase